MHGTETKSRDDTVLSFRSDRASGPPLLRSLTCPCMAHELRLILPLDGQKASQRKKCCYGDMFTTRHMTAINLSDYYLIKSLQ